ncbi:virulence factor SrfB [Azospirillum soli]|uniref:virulence factor SrfB n=1 Tax=Azospirillum soli TaxID=1304799 RepID=UPI001AE2D4A3|nr:virulence factor SrfB [Azospirillum soli]MBP2312696.1 hypothetical protein [Azospirillum soli]
MLAELRKYDEVTSLIMKSGIQFLDVGLVLKTAGSMPAGFVRDGGGLGLIRLDYDREQGDYHLPGDSRARKNPQIETLLKDTLALFDRQWLPIPVLRRRPDGGFHEGPTNWARARLVQLAEGEDPKHTHRLTIAFDTTVMDEDGTLYLRPTGEDVRSGHLFQFTDDARVAAGFASLPWVDAWLREQFEAAAKRRRMHQDDLAAELADFKHRAHFLHLLNLILAAVAVPQIKVIANRPDALHRPVPVDLILDLGNARTCGILIEETPGSSNRLGDVHALELRDLGEPQLVWREPFQSRVEFAQAHFGKDHLSVQSGLGDAFLWPTIARVGPEAMRLAGRRRGTDGATGLSSPKRYLWDENEYPTAWRFNAPPTGGASWDEPHATAAPFTNHIDQKGEALFAEDGSGMPVFMPHYSRSSLMTFTLTEILVQALTQINAPSQRQRSSHADLPRHLRRIILTVPPSMSVQEQAIYRERANQALRLVWTTLGWHPEDYGPEVSPHCWPKMPDLVMNWDEATCSQVLYLYNGIVWHFAGNAEPFFATMRRPRHGEVPGRKLRVASLDIGGGTTDLVVTDFSLHGEGINPDIIPDQLFREGFKIAGDDILLRVIQAVVVKAIQQHMAACGVPDPRLLVEELMGPHATEAQKAMLRQQLAVQVLHRIGLAVLSAYEGYDPVTGAPVEVRAVQDFFDVASQPSEKVVAYVNDAVSAAGATGFDLRTVPVTIDLGSLHALFWDWEIHKVLRCLCEAVRAYDCDVLLLSGRPSRLPAVREMLQAELPLPPDRVVPLHSFRIGSWYPFQKNGRIGDPKTTAAVGAMLCELGRCGNLRNFALSADRLFVKSTARYVGFLDLVGTITQDNVLDELDVDVRPSDETGGAETQDLAKTHVYRGIVQLGFRQLPIARWPATPLYLMHAVPERAEAARAAAPLLTLKRTVRIPSADQVRRGRKPPFAVEDYGISTAEPTNSVAGFRSSDVKLSLHTLPYTGVGESGYWIDTGAVALQK